MFHATDWSQEGKRSKTIGIGIRRQYWLDNIPNWIAKISQY